MSSRMHPGLGRALARLSRALVVLVAVPALVVVVPSSPAGAVALGWYLSFPAGACPSPDCPASVAVSTFSMSLATSTTGAAGTAGSGKVQVSVVASWDQGPLSVDLMRTALSQQVLPSFQAILAPTGPKSGASSAQATYTFSRCTIPDYVLEETAPESLPDAQVTLDCASVSVEQGGTGPGTPSTPPPAPGGSPNHAQIALTSKAGTVTTEFMKSLSISVSAAGPPSAGPAAVTVTGALDLSTVNEVDLVVATLQQTAYQTALITTGGHSTGTSYELSGPRFSAYALANTTGVQFTMEAQQLSVTSPGSAAACGANLITNPGAEAGRGTMANTVLPVPGWTTTGGFTAAAYSWSDGDLSPTTPGPSDRGKNYFYGGPSSATSTGTQLITLPDRVSTAKATYTLSGWVGGFSNQGDNATLFVTWENSAGQPLVATRRGVGGFPGGLLVSAQVGPVTLAQRDGGTTELLSRQVSGPVPAAAHLAKVVLVMQRTGGTDNDGLADNLSLVLSCP